jgi:3-isopropylmalate/(R)-2-methylmalate dehydratase large subunit
MESFMSWVLKRNYITWRYYCLRRFTYFHHGAFGAIAFGIGTLEVEMVLSTQCIMQQPNPERCLFTSVIFIRVTKRRCIIYLKTIHSGATGYFVEYAGKFW